MTQQTVMFWLSFAMVIGGWVLLALKRRKAMQKPQEPPQPSTRPMLLGTKINTVKTNEGMPVRYRLYLVFTTGELFIAANSDKEPLEAIETDIRKDLGL